MAEILILDTNPISRRFVASLLRHHGNSVLDVGDADEALTHVRLKCPDLMIIDIASSDTDGCRFVVRMRCDPGLPQPRVLMRAVAGVEPEARALAHAFGAAFVIKPTNSELLLATVSATLAEPPPQQGEPSPPADKSFERLAQPIAKLVRRVAERNAQLEVARTALDLEIKKRIWAEQDLLNADRRQHDQVVRDAVTGLYNRRFLEESLAREEVRAKRHGHTLAVMMIDVDHFKEFNDTLGHTAGDVILRSIGQCVVSLSRGEDIVARYDGDEFALMMANAPQETVRQRADLIRQRARSLEIGRNDHQLGPVTLSMGIAVFPIDGDSTRAVLEAADQALRTSKQAGRSRIGVGQKNAHRGRAGSVTGSTERTPAPAA